MFLVNIRDLGKSKTRLEPHSFPFLLLIPPVEGADGGAWAVPGMAMKPCPHLPDIRCTQPSRVDHPYRAHPPVRGDTWIAFPVAVPESGTCSEDFLCALKQLGAFQH